METRELGRTGLRVTVVGFGAAPVGGHYGDDDDASAIAAVRHAIDRGVNYLDTSPFYGLGRSETLVGEALRGGYRDKVILSTKAGRFGKSDFDFSAQRMTRSLDESLMRLGTDYVDIWLAHDIDFAGDFEQVFTETADALRQAKTAGKCRVVGMTGYPPGLLIHAIERCDLDVVLNYCHHSLTNSQLLTRLLPVAERHGVGLINASALMMGLLSRKGPPKWHPAPEPFTQACRRAVEHCRHRGVDLEVLALRYVLQDARIASTLVGMSNVREVDVNLRALQEPLDQELLAEVHAILAPFREIEWPSGKWPVGQ
jgi:L-galactose dehydrogenase